MNLILTVLSVADITVDSFNITMELLNNIFQIFEENNTLHIKKKGLPIYHRIREDEILKRAETEGEEIQMKS